MRDTNGVISPLVCIEPDKITWMLGVFLTVDANNTTQIKEMKDIAER